MRALLCLASVDMYRQWFTTAHQYDASTSDFGIVSALLPEPVVRAAGRTRERYRYRGFHQATEAPRQGSLAVEQQDHAHHQHAVSLSDQDALQIVAAQGFPELSSDLIEGRKWRVDFLGRWHRRRVHITSLEASCRTWVIRHVCRCVLIHVHFPERGR